MTTTPHHSQAVDASSVAFLAVREASCVVVAATPSVGTNAGDDMPAGAVAPATARLATPLGRGLAAAGRLAAARP